LLLLLLLEEEEEEKEEEKGEEEEGDQLTSPLFIMGGLPSNTKTGFTPEDSIRIVRLNIPWMWLIEVVIVVVVVVVVVVIAVVVGVGVGVAVIVEEMRRRVVVCRHSSRCVLYLVTSPASLVSIVAALPSEPERTAI